ncbi:MAG: amino acid permease [Ancrocorticia sp.]|nr:amino acid permease [Ancrocorticia sp.]MCI1896304.1 amino acid permease [Ancrocorticia sp.]MCI1933036.1 amino acid permease [Ancrocorticia sp.]MCI1964422.1 amino acid permease [Ancrocorticia sp.]MCI2003181.1 amino acid permease [Ancrocorticia sp.]
MSTGANNNELRRNLKNRHMQMIALGGAIGTGLFYGSASSIGLAGPAILVVYLVGGAVIFLIMRALGEMSVYEPVSGAFSHYAYENWSDRAGFVSGWNYWFNYVLVSMAELSVVGIYINYWFPGVPAWVTALACVVVITGVNVVSVRAFGEFEFWFAIIKVAAVIGMIVLGAVVVIMRINANPDLPDPSFTHLWDTGGFLPHGLAGAATALVPVMFSFGGVELIGITAGEADNPTRTIPRAINQIVYRILLFYVGSLAVIMSVIPWNRIDGKLSPFVQIFDSVGISVAADILNFVVLTAALSVYNSGLYSNGRMLYALARQGNAPRFLAKVNGRGTPVAGILVSSAVTLIAVLVVFLWPDFAFQYLMSIALVAGLINWSMIMVTERKFRRRLGPSARNLTFPLPGGGVATGIVLAVLLVVVVLMALSPDYRTAVIIGPLWVIALLAIHAVIRTKAHTVRA